MKRLFILVTAVAAICFGLWLLFDSINNNIADATPGQHQVIFLVDQRTYLNNGENKFADVAPFIQYGRVNVPVRYLGYALGIPEEKIDWDGETQTVVFNTDTEVIKFTVGEKWMTVNNEKREMDVAPVAQQDRVFVPARWLAEAMGYEVGWDEEARAILVGPPGDLPALPVRSDSVTVVGSYANLEKLLGELDVLHTSYYYGVVEELFADEIPMTTDRMEVRMDREMAAPSAPPAMRQQSDMAAGASNAADNDSGGGGSYSQTNVQVAGVDEADIVKTDGKYIYMVKGSQVIVAEAYPAGAMRIVSRLDYTNRGITPQEMYIDNKHMVIIGYASSNYRIMASDMPEDAVAPISGRSLPPVYHRNMVKAIVCDITNKTDIKQVREVEIEGSYVSSRKIGSSLYLLSNRYINYYPGRPVEDPQPLYRDTAAGDSDYGLMDYSRINCIPGFVNPNYLLVAGIDLNKPDEKAEINAYLGAGENIYASTQNLYAAVTGYRYDNFDPRFGAINTSQTKVYKFALNGGKVTYSASGEVPGIIVNQFSMDEHKGIFRIATTSGDMWRDDEHTSKNNVYNLDERMNIIGKLEGIAPGERIYSVRFMGDRGYMVTFKTVDPFFVIDLKDPSSPKVLGALKIPGYSDYMHPYDDNHIIGFGKETIELSQSRFGGSDTMAYYLGMKMAVFDVSDVSNPIEKFKETIGGRGTESPLLYNHKALLFSREKNLLAFPVTLMEVKGPEVVDGFPAYGEFAFQGAYVYDLDMTNGFRLKGRITHLSDQDYRMAGNYWYDSVKNVERLLYIDDILYTMSGRYIKANNLTDLTEINTLDLN